MMRPLVLSFSVLAFSGAWAQTAQPQQPSAQTSRQSQQQQSPQQMSADQLIDSKVTDSQGEDLGEIKDVVLDLQGGKIHAVVLEVGGTAGIGAKQFAFPANELKPGKSQGQFMVSAQKQALENAQGYAKGQWPALGQDVWGKEGQAGAGGSAAGGAEKGNLARASELLGKEVNGKSGEQVGELKDVTLDLTGGQVKGYVVTAKGGGQAQVEPQAVSQGADDKLVLNLDAEQLKQQAGQSSGRQQQEQQQK